MSLLYFVCFVLTVKWHETPRDCEVARSLPVAVSVQLCLATRWTCSMRFGSMSLINYMYCHTPTYSSSRNKKIWRPVGIHKFTCPIAHVCARWGGVGWGGPQEVHHFLSQHIKRPHRNGMTLGTAQLHEAATKHTSGLKTCGYLQSRTHRNGIITRANTPGGVHWAR